MESGRSTDYLVGQSKDFNLRMFGIKFKDGIYTEKLFSDRFDMILKWLGALKYYTLHLLGFNLT